MNDLLTELGGIWSSIKDGIYDTWLDWSQWLIGYRDGEAGGIATALFIVMVCSAILAIVMAVKRPRTLLEKSLFVRELFLTILLAQFFIAIFWDVQNFWMRIAAYALLVLSSLAIAFFLVKEYTFDVWELRDHRIRQELEQLSKETDKEQAQVLDK